MPCQHRLGRQERVWAKWLELDIRASANVGTLLDSQSAKPSVCAFGRFPLSEICFSVSTTGTWTLSRFKNVPKKRCSFTDFGWLCDGRCFGTQVWPRSSSTVSGLSMIVAHNDNDYDTLR